MNNKTIKTQLVNQLNDLINKEIDDNKAISGTVINKYDNNLEILLDKVSIFSVNSQIEINREKSKVIKSASKKITVSLSDASCFSKNEKVTIKDMQKDIIIHKLNQIKLDIEDNNLSMDNNDTLDVIFDNHISSYEDNILVLKNLNHNQRKSVRKAVGCDKFHIIQGPPGTGKTHTIAEIIKQLYKRKNRILITSHTHVALDNILEKLDFISSTDVLRIGLKSKISNQSLKYTMEAHIKADVLYEDILKKEEQIKCLKNDADSLVVHNESFISKLIGKFIKINNATNNIEDNTKTNKNNQDIIKLKEEIEKIKENIQQNITKTVPIIASTVISSSSNLTKEIEFDYVIMDEASQVPVYLSLIPLLKTKKFILIGDQKQLQPINNPNASLTLNKSIFNLLIEKYSKYSSFLNIQYRMNKEISDMASSLYYNNKLETYPKIEKQKIILNSNNFLLNNNPITYIDTSNVKYTEDNINSGCSNKYESQLVLSIVKTLLDSGFCVDSIGIITPYKRHKQCIQKLLRKNGIKIETDTIYRFQGREKDIIIMCFCKSSYNNLSKFQQKFISNENQLNVSITRSKRKLIIIGDSSQLSVAINIFNLFNMISPINTIYLSDCMES